MKTRKKILTFLLVLTLIMTSLPAQLFANEVIDTPINLQTDLLDSQRTTPAIIDINPNIFVGDGYEVEFKVNDKDSTTFTGEILLTNTGELELENWSLEFSFDHEIIDLQNVVIEKQNNNSYTIKGVNGYSSVPVGQSVSLLLKANYYEEIILPTYYMLDEEMDFENYPQDEYTYRLWKEKIIKKQQQDQQKQNTDSTYMRSLAATEPTSGTISNEFIKFNYLNGNYGVFTTGGNPDNPNDDNKNLLYGSGGTSYTTVRIDGVNHTFTPDTVTRYDNKIIGTKRYNDIIVSQHISIISNQYTKRDDVVEFFYTVENTSSTPHNVGIRIMFDTMLGGNDSAPFRLPALGNVTTETDLKGEHIPEFWQAFDSLSNPSVIAQGTLNLDKASTPDRARFTNWSAASSNPWDYTRAAGSSNGDSAVALYWNERSLVKDDLFTCKTFYGLSALQQDLRPPLAVALTGATKLEVVKNKDGKEEYSPNPFTVTAYIQNIGTGTALNSKIALNLPQGMEIVEGSKTVNLGDIPVGTTQHQISWKVKVAPSSVEKVEKYGVTVTADNADPKTLEREITIPKLQTSNIKLLLDRNSIKNGNTLNLKFKIINEGNEAVDLSQLCARYYYMDESPNVSKQINCDSAQFDSPYGALKSNVTMKSVQNIAPLRKDANAYVEFGFNASTKQLQPGQSASISSRINNSSWANMLMTNDYSYIGNNETVSSGFVAWEYMPVYNIANLNSPILGIEPPIDTTGLEPELLVEFKPQSISSDNSMKLNIKITNKGKQPTNLEDFGIKYYYTNDNGLSQSVNKDWIGGRINNLYSAITTKTKVKVESLNINRERSNSYVDITFDKEAGILSYDDYIELQLTVYNTGWKSGKYIASNDYSYTTGENSTILNKWGMTDKIIIENKRQNTIVGREPKLISYEILTNPTGILSNRGMHIKLKIDNTGEGIIDLNDLKLEYYYTNDNDFNMIFKEEIINLQARVGSQNKVLNSNHITANITPMDPLYIYEFADTCIQLKFAEDAGILDSGESVFIDLIVANANLLKGYNIENDHSYLSFLLEKISGENRTFALASNWEYRVNKGVLGTIFSKREYIYKSGYAPFVICKKTADFGQDIGYSRLNNLMKAEGFENKLGPKGYEFLLIYEMSHRDINKEWSMPSIIGVCPGCSLCKNSQHIGLKGVYCEYKLQYLKAIIVEYGNTGKSDGHLTLGYGTAIPLLDSTKFNETIDTKVTPYAPKLATLLKNNETLLLWKNSITNDEAQKYRVTLNEALDMVNGELIYHIRSLNNQIKNTTFKGFTFKQHEFDAMVTLRYKQGNLNEFVDAIKAYKNGTENPTVEDWINRFGRTSTRFFDQFEMFLEGDYERRDW